MKQCTRCKTDKPLTEFSLRSKDQARLHSWCKACVGESTRAWQRANRDKTKQYKARWESANREKHLAGKRRRYHATKDETLARRRERRKANPEAVAEYNRKRREIISATVGYAYYRHRLTLDRRQEMLDAQGNACAICRVSFDEKQARVDHDHACCPDNRSCGNCIRGLLCPRCNAYLGWYEKHRGVIGEYLTKRPES